MDCESEIVSDIYIYIYAIVFVLELLLLFSTAMEQLLRHVSLLRDPCSLGVSSRNGHHLIDPFGWSLKMSLYMGYVKCAVAIIPFAPPTPVRFNLSGAGGDLKTHSPASNIILNCGAIHSLRGLLLSLPTTFTVYMHTVQGVAYVQH